MSGSSGVRTRRAAGAHGGGEGDEAGFVDAEIVDAMEDDERRGVRVLEGGIEAGADGTGGGGIGEVFDSNPIGDSPAERLGDGLIGDEVEDGGSLKVDAHDGPSYGA